MENFAKQHKKRKMKQWVLTDKSILFTMQVKIKQNSSNYLFSITINKLIDK